MCDGATPPDFAAYENAITYNDPEGNFGSIAWFSDIGLTLPLTPGAMYSTGIRNCLVETHTVYVGIVCI